MVQDTESANAPSQTLDPNDRVARNTSDRLNAKIDRQISMNVRHYASKGSEAIDQRIRELDREWDIERILEVNASSLAMAGLILGFFKNKKFLLIPSLVLPFLFQHGIQGWCPPLPFLRRLGIRTQKEIEKEKWLLKASKGDLISGNIPKPGVG